MKKSNRKLALRPQIIRVLADETLHAAAGGQPDLVGDLGIIMKDSIIVRTGTR